MKIQLKSAVSVLLCLLLIFGQCTPFSSAGITAAEGTDVSVTGDVYNDAESDTVEKVRFAPDRGENPVICGEIKTPSGYTAPPGGVDIEIFASNGSCTRSKIVNIPFNQDKVGYSIEVTPGTGYVVYYRTLNINYVKEMYCGYVEMVRSKASAAVHDLSAGDVPVDITLVPMRVISGKIKFPEGTSSTKYIIYAVSDIDKGTAEVTLENNEASFSIPVPPNNPGSGYTVRYEVKDDKTVISPGYYSQSGTQRFADLAERIDVRTSDKTDLDIEIIKKKIIKGTLSLPAGATIPGSSLDVSVNASYGSDGDSKNIVLTSDKPSAEYTLYVPEGSGYTVWYSLNNVEQFMPKGYYKKSETVLKEGNADLVNVTSDDRTDVNIELIAKRIVSGMVKLPDGQRAPAGGVDVTVKVGGSSAGSDVKIPEGAEFAYYTVYVPEGTGYTLYYETKNPNYTSKGYYNTNRTVGDANSATTFSLGSNENKNDLHIVLIASKVISGTIQLPSGTADGDIEFSITASGTFGTGTAKAIIPNGQRSTDYSLIVPPGTKYTVKCVIEKGGITYIKNTYYSTSKTVSDSSFAYGIDTTAGNQPDIDFTLLEKRKVSGTLSLPDGVEADPYDNTFYYTDKDDGRVYTATIKANERTADFTFYFNPGIHIFYYQFGVNDVFVEKGYYSQTGTVMDESAATPINVTTGDATGVNFKFILKQEISGTVKLANEKTVAQDVGVTVRAKGKRGDYTKTVIIPKGGNNATFKINVPPGNDYILSYNNVSVGAFVSPMYYNSGNMTPDEKLAGYIDVSKEPGRNINLYLYENRSIQGRIEVPEKDKDKLATDLKVRMYVENKKTNYSVGMEVIIPKSIGWAPYCIYVPAGYEYIVRYGFNSENNDYVKDGYYSNGVTVQTKGNAQTFDFTNTAGSDTSTVVSDVNLSLIKKKEIKGTVSLPAGASLTSSLKVDLLAGGFSTSVTLQPGINPVASYTLKVPSNEDANSGYKVYYRIGSNVQFNEIGYYGPSGIMVSSEGEAGMIDLGSVEEKTGIDICLMSKSSISGLVKLPSNNLAVKETKVRVYAKTGNTTTSQEFIIKEGTNSTPYSLLVPAGPGYTVYYDISDNAYVRYGYYKSAVQTVTDNALATGVDVGNQGITGIDLTIIGNAKIEGIISLPNGKTAPTGGLYVTITVQKDKTNVGSVQACIRQGFKSVFYTLYVPPENGYKVFYQVNEKSYMPKGFYNSEATTSVEEQATLVNADSSTPPINFVLIPKKVISGIISIPPGSEPQMDISVRIYAVSGSDSYRTDVSIPYKDRFIGYEVYVPKEGSYEVRYEVDNNKMFISPGYYNKDATMDNKAKATPVQVVGDIQDIDLTLIPKMCISGTIFIKNEYAPARGLTVKISVANDKLSDSMEIVIPEGSNSMPYTIYMPKGKDYVVSYTSINSEKYLSPGYYKTASETIRDKAEAGKFDLTNGSYAGVNLTLIRKKEISGVITLNGTAPYGGLGVTVTAYRTGTNGSTDKASIYTIIPEGIGSLPYTIYVPEGADYRVKYELDNSSKYPNVEKYVTLAYYTSGGTVRNETDSGFINLTYDNNSHVDLNIISKYLIAGSINLPDDLNAPTGGFQVKVFASNNKDSVSKIITIPEWSNGADYKLYVPKGLDYKVGYELITGSADYIKGYHNVGGTVKDDVNARLIPVDTDIYGINMTIIKKRIVSGKISIDENDKLSAEPVKVRVYAGSDFTVVDIPVTGNPEERKASYTLKVIPPNNESKFYVRYELVSANEEYVSKAYYGKNAESKGGKANTVYWDSDAEHVDIKTGDQKNIDMVLLGNRVISGSIALPDTVKSGAPAGGITVEVSVEGTNITKSFVIKAGEDSTNYTMFVPPNAPGKKYKIKYIVKTTNTGYAETAYFRYSGPVQNSSEASEFTVINGKNEYNLKLIGNRLIEGTVELPEEAPENGINVKVEAICANNGAIKQSTNIFIPRKGKNANYSLNVPPQSNYYVYYEIQNERYVTKGYFAGGKTVKNETGAIYVSTLNGNAPSINLAPILKNIISGKITLPDTAPKSSNIQVKICAESISSSTNNAYVTKYLTADTKQDFEIFCIPDDKYRLYYEVVNSKDFTSGYYSSDDKNIKKAVLDSKSALVIDLSGENNYKSVDFAIIMSKRITGKVEIAEEAPAGGIAVTVNASNGKYGNTAKVNITEGNKSASFEIPVAPTSGYYLYYEVDGKGDYYPKAYYKSDKSDAVLNISDSYKLDLTTNEPVVTLNLKKYNSIYGEVNLPEYIPGGGMSFIVAAAIGDKDVRTKEIQISKDFKGHTVGYKLYVPDGNDYKIYYSMPENDNYADRAYYNNTKMVLEKERATSVGSSDNTPRDLSIIIKRSISGKIIRPAGNASMDILVDVSAIDLFTGLTFKKTVKIPAGSESIPYTVKVLPNDPEKVDKSDKSKKDLGYVLMFETVYDYGFVKSGYYKAGSFVRNVNKADIIDVSSADYNGKDFELKPLKEIRGVVGLENGEVNKAPVGGMKVDIIAKNSIDSVPVSVTIPEGSGSAGYILYLPPNDDEEDCYTVRYENWANPEYLSIGYFNGISTVRYEKDLKNEGKIDVRGEIRKDVDLTIGKKRAVSGDIILPDGAPEGGLRVTVNASNTFDSGVASVYIPHNERIASYKLWVPAGSDYELYYELPIINDYVTKGYYGGDRFTSYKPTDEKLILFDNDLTGKNLEIIRKRFITGFVGLPDGQKAQTDIIVAIKAEDAGNTVVTIPANSNAVPYVIKAAPGAGGKGIKLSYEISSAYGFVTSGYYVKGGMVRNSLLAEEVNVYDDSKSPEDRNLTLVAPKKIKGKVMLPNGIKAENDITIKITGTNDVDAGKVIAVIPRGSNFAGYTLELPPNDRGYSYTVKYENWGEQKYTLYGFYDIKGTIPVTTPVLSEAEGVDISMGDAGNIDLILIEKRSIKGNIIVPEGADIPNEGLSIKVVAESGLQKYENNLTISKGTKLCPYTIYVEQNLSYRVGYILNPGSSFMENGYYTDNGTTVHGERATTIEISNSEAVDKDISLLIKRKITGTVVLPDGVTNIRGKAVVIRAVSDKADCSETVDIPLGRSSVSFETSVPSGEGYMLSYEVAADPDIASIGYYDSKSGQVVREKGDAEVIDLSTGNKSNVKIKLLRNRTIRGMIKLPKGTAQKDGLKVTISAVGKGDINADREFFIPAGQKSVPYELSVVPLSEYRLKYSVKDKDYEPLGYYRSNGILVLPEQADILDVSANDAEGINIILLEKKEICGKVSLPQGIAYDNDIVLDINAVNTRTGKVDSQKVTVLSNKTSVPYSLKLTSGAVGDTYKVYYKIDAGYGVLETGYYNTSLMVPDINLASPLSVANGSIVGVNLQLIKSRTISGEIRLDSGIAGSGGMTLNVYAQKTGYTGYRVEKNITIEEGNDYARYELNVPEYTTPVTRVKVEARTSGKNSSDAKIYSISTNSYVPLADGKKSSAYKVGYSYVASSQVSDMYCKSGLYSNLQSGEVDVSGGNKQNIDMVVKLKDSMISGKLEIPDSLVIPEEGMVFRIKALNDKLDYVPETIIRVMPLDKLVAYQIPAPAMNNYRVKYEVENPVALKGFMESGFFSSSNITVGKDSRASYVDANLPGARGINLRLIPGIELGGTIKLPSGMKAQYDKFGVMVNVSNDDNQYSMFVPIVKDYTSAVYKVYVPAGKDYKIGYTTQMLSGEYVKQCYYNHTAATTEVNNASKIEIDSTKGSMDVTLIPVTRTITGMVSLPEGKGDTAFALDIPANEIRGGYNVSYTVLSENSQTDTFINGFYSKEGTVKDIDASDLLDVFDGSIYNIKMPLYKEGTIPLYGMVINKNRVTMLEGASVQLGVAFHSQEATNKILTWSSSNTNVAKVSSDGKVTALAEGSAEIKAVSSNMITVQCEIIVTAAEGTGLSLDKKNIYLVPGDTEQLNAIFGSDMEEISIEWSSDDSDIANVTGSGLVNANKPGTVIILATSKSDPSVKAICTVRVINTEVKISLDKSYEEIMPGQAIKLKAKVTADETITTDVIWSSSDPMVATVDDEGVVSGKREGAVVITARSCYNSSICAKCEVKVLPIEVTGIQFEGNTSIEMYTFDRKIIKAIALPYNAKNRKIRFVSDNTSIIRVVSPAPELYGNGYYGVEIEALIPTGNNTVKLKAISDMDNKIVAECSIKVKKVPVTSLTRIGGDDQATQVGSELILEVKVAPDNATNRGNITWRTSNSNYVSAEIISGNNMKCKVKGKAITPTTSPVTVTAELNDEGKLFTTSFKITVGAVDVPIIVLPGGDTALATPNVTPTPTPTLKVTPTPTATSKVVVKPEPTKPASGGISDYKDIKGHWAYQDFELLLRKGIIGGYPDKTLRPNAEITRAEISKIIVVAAGYQPSDNTNLTCADKDKVPDWAKPYIKTAMNVGIMSGFEDNTFRPGNKLTRKEMAKIIMSAFSYDIPSNGSLDFKDADRIPSWAKDYVAEAVKKGIIKGYSDKTFKPDKTITRAEVAAMIARCIK